MISRKRHQFGSPKDLPDPLRKRIFAVVGAFTGADRLKRITFEDGKCGRRPCIRGHRLRVADVLELLANGASFDEILADYSFLEREDIFAAIQYASLQTNHTILQTS